MSCRITGKICDAWSDVVGCGLVRRKFVEKKDGGKILNGETVKDCHQMTNADRIRSMSDEELSAWIASMTTVCECCAEINECESPKCFNKCLHGVEDWLKQPPKGESNNE